MAYEEMSREEAGGIFFRSPAQPQAMPVEAAPMAPQPAGQKPTPVKASKSTSSKIDTQSMVSDVAAGANQMREEAPKPEMISPIDTMVNELISNWKPLAIGAGAVVGGELLRRSIQRKAAEKNAPPAPRIEPTFNAPEQPPVAPAAATPSAPEPKPLSPMEILQQRKEQMKSGAMGVQPPAPSAGPTYNVPTADVPAIPPAAATPTAVAPVQPPMAAAMPEPSAPAIADAVAAGESPSKAIQMDVAKQIEAAPMVPPPEAPAETGIKKRAAKTPVTFKSAEKLPEGISFRADLGPGDNWLFNTYGPEGRKAILQQFNEGKPAVSYERAKELSQMLQQERIGPVIPRDVAKERGIAPPETNYGKLGKAVKVAGVAGLGLTAAQLAQAAQQAQQGNLSAAREFGFNLLGMIPGLGAAFNMGTYAPELGAGEQKELAKRRRMAPTID